jgi:hypothetical protein
MAGYRVRYVLAAKLVNELVEAADDKQLTKTIACYGRVDLLCIDELGYMELDRRGAELLFQVLTEREQKNSMAIASNENFSGWTKTFTDPRLCAAIVDRLTFGGNIIETGSDSTASRKPAPEPGTPPADTRTRCPLPRGGFAGEFRPRLGAGLPAATAGCTQQPARPRRGRAVGRPRFCPAIPAGWNRISGTAGAEPRNHAGASSDRAAARLVRAVLRAVRRHRRLRRSQEEPSLARRGPPWRRSGPRRQVTRS